MTIRRLRLLRLGARAVVPVLFIAHAPLVDLVFPPDSAEGDGNRVGDKEEEEEEEQSGKTGGSIGVDTAFSPAATIVQRALAVAREVIHAQTGTALTGFARPTAKGLMPCDPVEATVGTLSELRALQAGGLGNEGGDASGDISDTDVPRDLSASSPPPHHNDDLIDLLNMGEKPEDRIAVSLLDDEQAPEVIDVDNLPSPMPLSHSVPSSGASQRSADGGEDDDETREKVMCRVSVRTTETRFGAGGLRVLTRRRGAGSAQRFAAEAVGRHLLVVELLPATALCGAAVVAPGQSRAAVSSAGAQTATSIDRFLMRETPTAPRTRGGSGRGGRGGRGAAASAAGPARPKASKRTAIFSRGNSASLPKRRKPS
jgi:hypothetical protein